MMTFPDLGTGILCTAKQTVTPAQQINDDCGSMAKRPNLATFDPEISAG
jgi:hypothetical protein